MNKETSYSRINITNPVQKTVNYILLILTVLLIIMPIVILFLISFKTNEEYARTAIWDLPENFLNFENYIDAFVGGKMLTGFKNTFTLMIACVPLSLLMGSMAAFSLSRNESRLRGVIVSAFLLAMIIPTTTSLIATFNVINKLGVYNTIWAGVLLYLSTGVVDLYVFMQFIDKIPKSLDESAMVDGASQFKIFWTIILPQIKPAIATVMILKILSIYNDFFIPKTFMTKSNLMTISMSLYRFSSDRFQQWNILAAGMMLILIPTIILYLFLQKYIISGVTDGAVKE